MLAASGTQLIQHLQSQRDRCGRAFHIIPIKPNGDKVSRLTGCSTLIENGTLQFPPTRPTPHNSTTGCILPTIFAGLRKKNNKKHPAVGVFHLWRMGRDSNPRKSCPFSGFQDRRIRPLCHPSETVFNRRSFKPAVLFMARVLVTVRVHSIFIFYVLQL